MALTEHTLDSEQLLEGGFLRVYRDRVRLPDGSEARREYIAHPGAVASQASPASILPAGISRKVWRTG